MAKINSAAKRRLAVDRKAEETLVSGHPVTPDGRYFFVRGRLWRMANPALASEQREQLVRELMEARRALRGQRSAEDRATVRAQVQRVKVALGERGPVWWDDGSPDFNRKLVKNTPYSAWFAGLQLLLQSTENCLKPAQL